VQPASVDAAPAAADAGEPSNSTTGTLDQRPARVEFGAEGSRWWSVTGGWGMAERRRTEQRRRLQSRGLDVVVHGQGRLGGRGTAAWYHSQPGNDAASINPSVVFRWHFVNTGDWTVYADIGIGFLVASDEVPSTGTTFDFTPRAGVGFTRRLDDSETRLVVGLRWAHFSNARIHGDDDNPSRDDLMAYAGLTFPF
jgi:hypothetical protein